MRALAKQRNLNYDSCYAAVCRLRLWCAQNSPGGKVPDEQEIIGDITEFPDGPEPLTQLLLDAKIFRAVLFRPAVDGLYLEGWTQEQDPKVTNPSEAREKKRAAGRKSGEARRVGGELEFEESGDPTGHAHTGAKPPNTRESNTPKLCSNTRSTDKTRPDKTRPDEKRPEEKTAVVGVSQTSFGAVLSGVDLKIRLARALKRVWHGQTKVEDLIVSWQRKRGEKPISEEAILDFIGLCIEAPAKKRDTVEKYVIGMTGMKLPPAEKSVQEAARVWRSVAEVHV